MNQMFLKSAMLVVIAFFATASPAGAAMPIRALGQAGDLPTLAPVLEKVTPGVVNIAVRGRIAVQQNPLLRDPFFRRFFNVPERPVEREFQSAGSGVVVDAERGYILTNHHVVARADEIIVGLKDRRRVEAKLVGADPEVDIAVIKVPPESLVSVPFGDSSKLKVGDFVVAIGNPFGLGQTVTSGIVSALGRSGLGIEGYEDFIQTDASINPGNSGGALIDLRGKLIGINTAIVGPSGGNVGIGFAIPINMAREIMDQIVRFGQVRRGQLGVVVRNLSPREARELKGDMRGGAVVTEIVPGTAAEKIGLRRGDVIVAVNNVPVRDASHLRNRIGVVRLGEKVELRVNRAGGERTFDAKIGPRTRPRRSG